jgi:predicted transcriptional regulator
MDSSTDAREQALALYSGPHRTYGAFLMIAEGPKTLQEITTGIPLGDPDRTEAIIQDLLSASLVQGRATGYELTEYGQRVRAALNDIPQADKDYAWRKNWLPRDTKDQDP